MTLASAGPFAGRYTLEREIGRGATATVWLALDATTGERVALKILRPELAEGTERSHFTREIRRTGILSHPRILPVLDAGDTNGTLYFALPYMPDGTLRARLKSQGQLGVVATLAIAQDLADALGHAHAQGLVHRDVKPENILFRGEDAHITDFGIAQALQPSADESTTSRTIVRGTVAYMSPEQASGVSEIDGRSDLFSLGCVMYEMLAGVAAFTGPSESNILTQVLLYPPRELRVYRRNVPAALQGAIEKCLAVSPADRFTNAAELVEVLRGIDPDSAPRVTAARRAVTGVVAMPHPWWRRAMIPLIVAAAAVATTMLVSSGIGRGGGGTAAAAAPPDTSLYVVFPLTRDVDVLRASAGPPLDDDQFREGLARWAGVDLVDAFQVQDALGQQAGPPTVAKAASIALQLGAGRFFWGELTPRSDSVWAYVVLFDASNVRALHDTGLVIPGNQRGASEAWARIASALLLRGGEPDAWSRGTMRVRPLAAAQAFAQGERALASWELARADTMFALALEYDAMDARTLYRLAQVRAWRSRPVDDWAGLATSAALGDSVLPPRERRLGRALADLGSAQYAAACAKYDALRRANPREFAAWYGLGQCRTLDLAIVRDGRSESGWRFRSSRHAATQAYEQAFALLPTVHRGFEGSGFDALKNLLLLGLDGAKGFSLPDSARFEARPALLGDTLVLVPVPWRVFAAGGPGSNPVGFAEAIKRQRETFRAIAARWSAALPRSSEAKEAVAIALELLGNPAAIDTARTARGLEPNPDRRLLLAAAEVRLLLKFGVPDDLDALRLARRLADSILIDRPAASPEPTPTAAEHLAMLAALRGDCDALWRFLRAAIPARGYYGITPDLLKESQGLVARVALRCRPAVAVEEIALLVERIGTVTRSRGPEAAALFDAVLLFRPLLLSFRRDTALLGRLARSNPFPLPRASHALAAGDPGRARAILDARAAPRMEDLLTPDMALIEARLWLALGDSARMRATIDATLRGVRDLDGEALNDAVKVAAIIRLMDWRAELAEAEGDRASLRRWRAGVKALRDPD